MELSHLLLILVMASASAKSLMEKQAANQMQKTGQFVSSKEGVDQSDAYNRLSEDYDIFINNYDDILCSFAGEYPDIELRIPSDIKATVDDLKSNFEFALSDMISSIADHIEVLQGTIEYVFDDALTVLSKAILNIDEADNGGSDSIKHIGDHLMSAINAVKLNLTNNVSQGTGLVTKYVYESSSSIFQKTDRIIETFFSVNYEILGQTLQLQQAFDTAENNLHPEFLATQESIADVFSYIQEAVETETNLLNTYLDASVMAVSEKISSLENSRDKNEFAYILNYTLHDQITSLHGILTEAVSTALFAIIETGFNFVAALKDEILVAAESLTHSSFDFEKLYLS